MQELSALLFDHSVHTVHCESKLNTYVVFCDNVDKCGPQCILQGTAEEAIK